MHQVYEFVKKIIILREFEQISIRKAIYDQEKPYGILVYVIFDIIAKLKNFMHATFKPDRRNWKILQQFENAQI